MTKVQFFISDLCNVIRVHHRPSVFFFIICRRQNEGRGVKQAPMCLSRPCASIDIQYDLFRVFHELRLPWPEVKFSIWPFEVMLCIIWTALTKQRRWCLNQLSLSLLDKPGSAKNYFPKMHFLTFYLWSLNYWQMVKSEVLFQKKRFKRNRLLF